MTDDVSDVGEQFADEQTELSAIQAFRAINRKPEAPSAGDGQTHEELEPATPSDSDASALDGAAPDESADEADVAVAEADQQPSDEDEGQEDTADEGQPPIDPPSTWTKEEQEAFKSLPRASQQTIADRERARRAEIDRRLNDSARERQEAIQQASAREQAAEQARQHYEAQLPNLLQAIQTQFSGAFSDVKTWEDVQKMAQDDPVRYGQWQAMREQHRAVQEHMQNAQQRQQQEYQQKLRQYHEEQRQQFLSKAPEFADSAKAPQLFSQIMESLQDVGFAPDEINHALNNGGVIPVHDHRFHLMAWRLARAEARLKEAENKVRKAPAAPVPQVQRPGPAITKREAKSEHVKNLEDRLSRTGSRRDALALMRARNPG